MASIAFFAGSVPDNYETYLGPMLFEPYALELKERLRKDKLDQVLELACGTGRVTRHLSELVPDNGRLVATDINPDMLELARLKIRSEKIEWMVADAQDLPFEDNRFGYVVCQFGVVFFRDKERGFREACRVLKPGGRFIFNTWEAVEKNPRIDTMWKVIYEVFEVESPDLIRKGPHAFFDKAEIEKLLVNAGFNEISIETVVINSRYRKPDDLVRGFADGSPLRNYLSEKDEKLQLRFRKRLQEALNEQDKILGKHVPCVALVVEAIK